MHHNLTVAICAYNCEKYIEETLNCIVNQSFQQFDLLIVNDCSTDNSEQIITSFFNKKPRKYNLINFKKNLGLAAGRKYVENFVSSKYIIFIDADDCPHPNMFERLYYKISSDEDLMAVGCYLEFIDSNGLKIKGGQFLGDKTKAGFLKRARDKKLIFLASNAIFNRQIANSVGGRSTDGFFSGMPRYQDLCEDLDLWTRMSDLYKFGKAIIVIPEVLISYRKHSQGLSSSSFNMFLRMSHIKTNLLLRREGLDQKSFKEFFNNLSDEQINTLKLKSRAADNLRNAVFFFREGKWLNSVLSLSKSIILNPIYFLQKIRANTKIFNKNL